MSTVTKSTNVANALVYADSMGSDRSLSVQTGHPRSDDPCGDGIVFTALGNRWLIDVRLNREQVRALVAQLRAALKE